MTCKMQIIANENIRVDGTDYTRDQKLASIETDVPFSTLHNMIQMGQARIISDEKTKPTPIPEQIPKTPVASQDAMPAIDEPLTSFQIPERFVDMLAEQSPPILFKTDVVEYLETHADLTPINGIGKTTSDRILSALGLA